MSSAQLGQWVPFKLASVSFSNVSGVLWTFACFLSIYDTTPSPAVPVPEPATAHGALFFSVGKWYVPSLYSLWPCGFGVLLLSG